MSGKRPSLAEIAWTLLQAGEDVDKMDEGELRTRFGLSEDEATTVTSALAKMGTWEMTEGGKGSGVRGVKDGEAVDYFLDTISSDDSERSVVHKGKRYLGHKDISDIMRRK